MSRVLSALVLSLVLAVTSVTLAVSRGQAAGLSEMVICSDGAAVTVTVDAQGNPVERPHHCPDCLVQAAADWSAPPVIAAPATLSRLRFALPARPDVAERTSPNPAARGPPTLV